jgi:hypothetical protein
LGIQLRCRDIMNMQQNDTDGPALQRSHKSYNYKQAEEKT